MHIKHKIPIFTLMIISGLIIIFFSIAQVNNTTYDNHLSSGNSIALRYLLNNPDAKFELTKSLNEISGLTYYKDEKILCIQDESAKIYVFDVGKNEVDKKYNFNKNGDFEGITIQEKTLWLLNSSGDIFRIKNYKKKDYKIKKYNTPLTQANDCEGLSFDPVTNSLLIACKGSASISGEDDLTGYKAVYRFDLSQMKLIKEPYLLIDLSKLINYDDMSMYDRLSHRLLAIFGDSGDIRFQPSGIAVHPESHNIFIIASVGSSLIEMDRKGKVLSVNPLKKELHLQPEGICFDLKSNLYIANEGRGGRAVMYMYKPTNK